MSVQCVFFPFSLSLLPPLGLVFASIVTPWYYLGSTSCPSGDLTTGYWRAFLAGPLCAAAVAAWLLDVAT